MTGRVERPRGRVARRSWRALTATSLPFAVQDVLGVLLAKVDALMLSLMANDSAVGRYGAAYRVLEATFFLTSSLTGAFAAMYTYLGRDTEPSVRSVFQRSVKLGLIALVPCAVCFGVLAEPLTRLVFGAEFEQAAEPLRLLAPVTVLLSLATLSSSLVVSRRDPRPMVVITALMVAVNVALNAALIPAYDDDGAAAAMLATAILFAAVNLTLAARTVGGFALGATFAGPLAAGLGMAVPLALLEDTLAAALLAGVPVYAGVLVAVERVLNPGDLALARDSVRRRLAGFPRPSMGA